MSQKSSIGHVLSLSTSLLRDKQISSARLDTEMLLAHVLDVERSWLHAHRDDELDDKTIKKFESLIKRRLKREPIAYIIGKKEFYGRDFMVTPDVLIPRPETEGLVELALEIRFVSEKVSKLKQSGAKPFKVLDVGCGSGCVGITLKLERPEWNVTLSDISPKALEIASENAVNLGANVTIVQSNLLSSSKIYSPKSKNFYDLIAANLPYVDKSWPTSPETKHEPAKALYAENGGLELIFELIQQSPQTLKPDGYLLLEADPEQHATIVNHAQKFGFYLVHTNGYALALKLA